MITHPAPPPRQGRGLAHWQAVLLLGVALFLVYAQTGHYGYIDFDDTAYIQDNLMVRRGLSLEGVRWAFSSFYAANWHPLTWLSHMADVSIFGMDLGAHHLGISILLGVHHRIGTLRLRNHLGHDFPRPANLHGLPSDYHLGGPGSQRLLVRPVG
jgi:hypothetical protein